MGPEETWSPKDCTLPWWEIKYGHHLLLASGKDLMQVLSVAFLAGAQECRKLVIHRVAPVSLHRLSDDVEYDWDGVFFWIDQAGVDFASLVHIARESGALQDVAPGPKLSVFVGSGRKDD